MDLQGTDGSVRSIFISDVHLGSKYCRPEPLQELLSNVACEKLYIVGDFCDGWLLRRRWLWKPEYVGLVENIKSLQARGPQIFYLLGNHDRCLQSWIEEWGAFWIGEKIVHECADGRRLLVIHGDQFDRSQHRFKRVANISALLHEGALGGSRLANRVLTEVGLQERRLATALTVPIKALAHSFSQFNRRAKQLSEQHDCQGILCGHTHAPRVHEDGDGFAFLNSGDWLEHCTAIVESHSGQLELWMGQAQRWLQTTQRLGLVPATCDSADQLVLE